MRKPPRLFFWGVLLLMSPSQAMAQTANRIAAIVNDAVITETDVTTQMSAVLEEQGSEEPLTDDNAAQMRQMVLRRLIEQQVMLQEARRVEISVGTDDVLKRLEEVRARFESQEQFLESLKTVGMSVERLKDQLREQRMIQELIERHIRSTIVVSPQEVARAVAEHPELAKPGDRARASHLLIRVNADRSEDAARALIDDLRRQLVQGADFAAQALRYSEDPHQHDGGAMGWSAPGELLPELDAALFQLPVGELSMPIQTRLGFHLLRVDERRAASSLSLLEAHRTVYEQLYQRKFQEAFRRWLGELTRKAYIEIAGDS